MSTKDTELSVCPEVQGGGCIVNIGTGMTVAKSTADLVKNENVLNKATSVMGMLFPYAGLKQKAVNVYIEEIEKSDLSAEAKVFAILNIEKTFKKIKNQKNIADIAMENAKEDTDFSEDSKVNEEWLDRFMDSAGFVSDEELQLVWGKILANEFNKPGSTPPNMIRVLSEITPELARAFRIICSMCIHIFPLTEEGKIEGNEKQPVVPYKSNSEKFRDMGLSFKIMTELESLGVIKFEARDGYVFNKVSNKRVLIAVRDQLMVIEQHKKDEIPIGNVLLTSVGEALFAITDSVEVKGYYDMIKNYYIDQGIVFADKHEFVTQNINGSLFLYRDEE